MDSVLLSGEYINGVRPVRFHRPLAFNLCHACEDPVQFNNGPHGDVGIVSES